MNAVSFEKHPPNANHVSGERYTYPLLDKTDMPAKVNEIK